MHIVTGVGCFLSDFPIKRKPESLNISDPGGFWFLKKSLFWEEKRMEKKGKVYFHLKLLMLQGRPLHLAKGQTVTR